DRPRPRALRRARPGARRHHRVRVARRSRSHQGRADQDRPPETHRQGGLMSYYTPAGGLPPQTDLLTDRAVVKLAYTFIPKGVLRDIVTSSLPGFTDTRAWIIARPTPSSATTFSQLIVEIAPG